MSNKEYNAESIKVLGDIQHIQKRPGIYIGEANDPRQLISEIIDNAIDEVQAGFSKEAIVTVDTKKNSYTVRDYGRGIPHGKKKMENGEEKEILEVLLTKSHSGGKFDNSSYNYSSGLNGLGMTITNALSKSLEIISYRDGKYVKANANGTNEVDIEYGQLQKRNGTKVAFVPNKKYFPDVVIPIDFILKRCRIASALGFRVRLIVDREELDTNYSIFDLMKEENISTYCDIPTIEVENSDKEKMKVALKYTSDTTDRYFGYTNLLDNSIGGTHISELSKVIISTWKEFIDKNKNLKPDVELKPNDYLIGLRGVCAVFISKPEFSSQTKEKLVNNKKYFEELMENFKKQFSKWLKQNIDKANLLIKRFEEYRNSQNSLLNRKEISSLIKVNNDNEDNVRRRSVVSKLVECTSKKRAGTEMFIVEGDSALGPYKFVRNKETQAVLPLRGKILNVVGKTLKEAVQSKEICDIANSIGCGIGSACDANKSRYDRIIISADADPDGLQINCLVLAVFINLFPDLVRQGRVYVSLPPLYCWGDRPENYGWCNKIEDIPSNIKHFHRFKGLGEMEDKELYHFLVNPETRNVMQIEYPSDVEKFNEILGTSSGKNSLLKDLGIVVGEGEDAI